jgi:gamma-butyrobetaine dioxygenase
LNSLAKISAPDAANADRKPPPSERPQDLGAPVRAELSAPNELSIVHADGRRFALHPLWLRERCRDAISMDAVTGQRLHDPSDLDLALKLVAVTESSAGRFHVRFSDGHESDFLAAEILAEAALPPGDHDCPADRLWNGALRDLPRAAWSLRPEPAELQDWTERFLRYGFIIFSGVPTVPRQVLEVAKTFGFPRVTNFGELFDVRSTPNASDLAYTSVHLDAHTDNPYRSPVPGVQLLHCLANETRGGLSTLVDGFAVAEAVRGRDPEAFRILTSTAIRFRYRDATTELVASAAPIDLDVNGRPRTIHFSPRLDFVPLLPPETLTAYYRARRVFDQLLRAPEFEIRFLLNAGDLVMFDNCRLLHGRTGFDPAEGLRHLQGCYIDIDGPRSLFRVLRRRQSAAAWGSRV